MVLEREQFENSVSKKTKPRVSKCQCMGMHDDEKGQSLDKYDGKGEGKDIRYVPFPFIAPLSLPQKESNRPTDISKGIRSLNHLVYIPKIG